MAHFCAAATGPPDRSAWCIIPPPLTPRTDVNRLLRRPSPAANQAKRRRRFEGMERILGEAEDSPSDGAGAPVRRSRSRRQNREIPSPITRRSTDRVRSARCGRPGARSPEPNPRYPPPPDGSGRACIAGGFGWMLVEAGNCRYAKACQGETDGVATRWMTVSG